MQSVNSEQDAYLALGGNIGAVRDRIFAAWEILEQSPIITVSARSRLYRTAPLGGPAGQSDYVNAACHVRTTASPRALLNLCLDVEAAFGRKRRERWGPRTLDIDIILYDNLQFCEPGLTIPHPRLRERLFVLVPLLDVAPPNLTVPPDDRMLEDIAHEVLTRDHESLQDWHAHALHAL